MKAGFAAPFYRETDELEGNIEHIYCDSLGWVTVGVGHKIDSAGKLNDGGKVLPFRRYSDNRWASEAEILQEFDRIKLKGGDYKAAKTVARLFLTGLDRSEDFELVLGDMEEALKSWLPDWNTMPGAAQLAVLSMAWNLGSNFLNPKATSAYWPKLHSQLKSKDYFGAAGNCLINGRESARNRYNRVHFLNAQRVVNLKLADEPMAPFLDVSESKVVAASKSTSVANKDAWNVQAALKQQGLYTSSLDGKFGNVSQTAWKAYCKREGVGNTYSASTLKRLFADAKFGATVTT